MTTWRATAATVAVVLVLAAAAVFPAACGSEGTGATTTTAAKTAAEFSGVTLDGTKVSLSEYRGKPLILAFMASW